MAKLTGKELESIFAEEYTTRVGTGETTVTGTGENKKETAVRKLFRVHPINFHPNVVRYFINEGLGRMHGRFLNNVAVEKGMKVAAFESMLEELNAGEFPQAMEGKRQGSAALSSEDAMVVHLAKQDITFAVAKGVKGSGRGGRVIAKDILEALDGSKNFGDLVRTAGDSLAWDDKQVFEWATDESRKRDYVADARAELERIAEIDAAGDDVELDDLVSDL